MRRTTIILLLLLNVLTSVWAARSVDWSKRIVPKSYEADAVMVTKSDTAYHGKVYQIYRDALGSAILYVSKTDSCSFRYSPGARASTPGTPCRHTSRDTIRHLYSRIKQIGREVLLVIVGQTLLNPYII